MNRATRTQQKLPQSGNNNYAIVIGGSLAGLLTARVLADHFSHVTVSSAIGPLPNRAPGLVSHKVVARLTS
jgi:hypothetical protein